MNLPLPLQLSKPAFVADHDDLRTCGSFTASAASSKSVNVFTGIAVDVQVDSVVDDNL